MARILVTGGAGFIGANFVHHRAAQYPADFLYVLDALAYAGSRSSLEPLLRMGKVQFVQGDIGSQQQVEALLRDHNIDTIVNFAAETHVDRSILGPDVFVETNVVGTHGLLKAARQVWLVEARCKRHRFHHISTDEVFGSLALGSPAFVESSQCQPNSPYSASKAAADHLVRAYHQTFGLQTTTSHCSNNYGPFQFPEKLIPLSIVFLLQGKSLPLYGNGKHVRDWLYVEDHCRGIDLILDGGRAGETYNIGGTEEWDNLSLVQELCAGVNHAFAADLHLCVDFPGCPAAQGRDCTDSITFVADRAGHDQRYAIDSGKMYRELGFIPGMSFRNGLEQTIAWYLQNQDWWMPLLCRRQGV